MRRILSILLVATLILGLTLPCYAEEISEEDETVTGDVYARYVSSVEWDDVPVVDGKAEAATNSGYTVSAINAPSNATIFRVVPIPSAETTAWNWFAECIGEDTAILAVFDIYFEDADGNRINADGVTISISSVDSEISIYAVATSGNAVALAHTTAHGSITFAANGSHYYVLTQKANSDPAPDNDVIIEAPDGGDVEISDRTPGTGDIVTITPIPDEGKEVDKVVVMDQHGKDIPVTDNGDGTYSYVQPDGDVTIEITFKDKAAEPTPEYDVTIEKTTGGTVTVSDKTPQVGDTVTITVDPDDGKKVSKVIVTDENGNTVKVTKHADGTYSYIQPDSDVSIKVTFRDITIFDNPQTGDESNLLAWLGIMFASVVAAFILTLIRRKQTRNS